MSRWLILLCSLTACAAPDAEEPPAAPPARATPPETVARTPAEASDSAGVWLMTPQRGPAAAAAARRLVAVETGAHATFDRVVFTFDGPLPAYEVAYADAPVAECGSGRPVPVEGAPLVVRFEASAAHTDTGQPTVAERSRQPALDVLRSLRLTCDFEGEVAWVAGLRERLPFRVLTLGVPPRVVVDVAHSAGP